MDNILQNMTTFALILQKKNEYEGNITQIAAYNGVPVGQR